MNNINELMDECKKAIGEHVALLEEDNKLKEDLKEVVLKNWKIVQTEIKSFVDIRKLLAEAFHKYPTYDEKGKNCTGMVQKQFG